MPGLVPRAFIKSVAIYTRQGSCTWRYEPTNLDNNTRALTWSNAEEREVVYSGSIWLGLSPLVPDAMRAGGLDSQVPSPSQVPPPSTKAQAQGSQSYERLAMP